VEPTHVYSVKKFGIKIQFEGKLWCFQDHCIKKRDLFKVEGVKKGVY